VIGYLVMGRFVMGRFVCESFFLVMLPVAVFRTVFLASEKIILTRPQSIFQERKEKKLREVS
jgi:hypothetical protein